MAVRFGLFRALRRLLQALFGRGKGRDGGGRDWGRRIATERLEDLYGPRKVEKFTVAPPGIDNLWLKSTDTFVIPGRGVFTVDFDGYFRVARENGAKRWADANVYVNMVELGMRGDSELGPIHVSLNPELVSAGQTFGSGLEDAAAKCRIATGVQFTLPQVGMTLFNKEPILLMNDAIESVPPVEDPKGEAHIYYLPLFDASRRDGAPAAYLTRLRYTVGNYITRDEVERLRRETALR